MDFISANQIPASSGLQVSASSGSRVNLSPNGGIFHIETSGRSIGFVGSPQHQLQAREASFFDARPQPISSPESRLMELAAAQAKQIADLSARVTALEKRLLDD